MWKQRLATLVFGWLSESLTSLDGIPVENFYDGDKWEYDADPQLEREIYKRCMANGAKLIAGYFTISGKGGIPLLYASDENEPAVSPMRVRKISDQEYVIVPVVDKTAVTPIVHMDNLIQLIRDAANSTEDPNMRDREKAVYKAMELQLHMVQETLCDDHRWIKSDTGKGYYCASCGTERD